MVRKLCAQQWTQQGRSLTLRHTAHSEQFDKKQNVPTQLTALPDSGTALTADTIVTYNGKTWQCTEQHIKSTVYKPKAGSSKWSEYTE